MTPWKWKDRACYGACFANVQEARDSGVTASSDLYLHLRQNWLYSYIGRKRVIDTSPECWWLPDFPPGELVWSARTVVFDQSTTNEQRACWGRDNKKRKKTYIQREVRKEEWIWNFPFNLCVLPGECLVHECWCWDLHRQPRNIERHRTI